MPIDAALAALAAARFVPVLRAASADRAIAAGRALARGGCTVIELTLTTPDVDVAIAALVMEGLTVGAGTVMTEADAALAIVAGASFLVSPHLAQEVAAVARHHGRLYIPGALTPTEVIAASAAGAPVIKIFPVGAMGGPAYLKMLRDPLPHMRFFPTGGVTRADLPAYLAAGAVAVGVGTAIAPAGATEDVLEANARAWLA